MGESVIWEKNCMVTGNRTRQSRVLLNFVSANFSKLRSNSCEYSLIVMT